MCRTIFKATFDVFLYFWRQNRMKRYKSFTFRVSHNERRMISALAEFLQRTKSDAVRFVIVNAVKELMIQQSSRTNISNTKIENDGAK